MAPGCCLFPLGGGCFAVSLCPRWSIGRPSSQGTNGDIPEGACRGVWDPCMLHKASEAGEKDKHAMLLSSLAPCAAHGNTRAKDLRACPQSGISRKSAPISRGIAESDLKGAHWAFSDVNWRLQHTSWVTRGTSLIGETVRGLERVPLVSFHPTSLPALSCDSEKSCCTQKRLHVTTNNPLSAFRVNKGSTGCSLRMDNEQAARTSPLPFPAIAMERAMRFLALHPCVTSDFKAVLDVWKFTHTAKVTGVSFFQPTLSQRVLVDGKESSRGQLPHEDETLFEVRLFFGEGTHKHECEPTFLGPLQPTGSAAPLAEALQAGRGHSDNCSSNHHATAVVFRSEWSREQRKGPITFGCKRRCKKLCVLRPHRGACLEDEKWLEVLRLARQAEKEEHEAKEDEWAREAMCNLAKSEPSPELFDDDDSFDEKSPPSRNAESTPWCSGCTESKSSNADSPSWQGAQSK
eukprot:jgi/Bigna1/83959/fgenesh1_pg.119_\